MINIYIFFLNEIGILETLIYKENRIERTHTHTHTQSHDLNVVLQSRSKQVQTPVSLLRLLSD